MTTVPAASSMGDQLACGDQLRGVSDGVHDGDAGASYGPHSWATVVVLSGTAYLLPELLVLGGGVVWYLVAAPLLLRSRRR